MVAGFYNRFAGWFYETWEKVKGKGQVQREAHKANFAEDLIACSLAGYEIRIYCQKELYRRKYDLWFIPNERAISYRVYGVVSNTAPQKLKDICEFDLKIAVSTSRFSNGNDKRQHAIKAYLDVLIERLKDSKVVPDKL